MKAGKLRNIKARNHQKLEEEAGRFSLTDFGRNQFY